MTSIKDQQRVQLRIGWCYKTILILCASLLAQAASGSYMKQWTSEMLEQRSQGVGLFNTDDYTNLKVDILIILVLILIALGCCGYCTLLGIVIYLILIAAYPETAMFAKSAKCPFGYAYNEILEKCRPICLQNEVYKPFYEGCASFHEIIDQTPMTWYEKKTELGGPLSVPLKCNGYSGWRRRYFSLTIENPFSAEDFALKDLTYVEFWNGNDGDSCLKSYDTSTKYRLFLTPENYKIIQNYINTTNPFDNQCNSFTKCGGCAHKLKDEIDVAIGIVEHYYKNGTILQHKACSQGWAKGMRWTYPYRYRSALQGRGFCRYIGSSVSSRDDGYNNLVYWKNAQGEYDGRTILAEGQGGYAGFNKGNPRCQRVIPERNPSINYGKIRFLYYKAWYGQDMLTPWGNYSSNT